MGENRWVVLEEKSCDDWDTFPFRWEGRAFFWQRFDVNRSAKASLDVSFAGATKLSRTQQKLPQNLGMHIKRRGGCNLIMFRASARDVKLEFRFLLGALNVCVGLKFGNVNERIQSGRSCSETWYYVSSLLEHLGLVSASMSLPQLCSDQCPV